MTMPWRKVICGFLALVGALSAANAQTEPSERRDPSRVWIDRPWEFRYVLLVISEMRAGFAKERAAIPLSSGKPLSGLNLEPYAFFEPTHIIQTVARNSEPTPSDEDNIATLVIEFDKDRSVLTPNRAPHKLYGRLNQIEYIVLAPGHGPKDMQVDVGYFFMGPDGGAQATPAICDLDDMDRRYKPTAKFTYTLSRFGCREWGHYLYNPQVPYIDVSSYEPQNSRLLEFWQYDPQAGKEVRRWPDARIDSFIGWGRFDIKPKPVIGKHMGQWFCLHECPDGEAPGRIDDITQWAAKRGWPVPKKPKKMPLFPDPPYKRGDVMD